MELLASKRTTRRTLIATAAVIATGLLPAACAAPWISTPTPEPHESYSYEKFSSVDLTQAFHPGDELTFTWEAVASGTVHDAMPAQITLRAGLYGPFDSVDQLKQQMSSTNTPMHTAGGEMNGAAVQINPVQTNSWTNQTYTSTLTLPMTLKPGFYSFVRSSTYATDRNSSTGEAQSVLQVVAP